MEVTPSQNVSEIVVRTQGVRVGADDEFSSISALQPNHLFSVSIQSGDFTGAKELISRLLSNPLAGEADVLVPVGVVLIPADELIVRVQGLLKRVARTAAQSNRVKSTAL